MAGNYDSFWNEPDNDAHTHAWTAKSGHLPSVSNSATNPIDNPIPVQEFEEFKPSGQPKEAWFASHLIVTGLKVVGIIWILILGLFLVTRFTGSPDVASDVIDPAAQTTVSVEGQPDLSNPITTTNIENNLLGSSTTNNSTAASDTSTQTTLTTSATTGTPETSSSSSSATTAAPATSSSTATTSQPTTTTPPTTAAPTTASEFSAVEANIISQPNAAIAVNSVAVTATDEALRYNLSLDCRGRTDRIWLYVDLSNGPWPVIIDQPCSSTLTVTLSGLESGQSYRANLLFGNDTDWRNQETVLDFAASTR